MTATPCTRNPPAWDLPNGDVAAQIRTARRAVAACRQCPALAACTLDDARRAPDHDCIQAGRVHYRRHTYTLAEFRRVVGRRRNPADYEPQVYALFTAGHTDTEMADQLELSPNAVKCARYRMGLLRERRPLSPCGTPGAADRHRKRGEPLDEPCRAAMREQRRARRRARAGRPQHVDGRAA
jgi:hypothetical protein